MIWELHCNIRNSNIVVLFFQYFKEFFLWLALKLIFFKCFDRKWRTVPNQSTGNRKGSLYIFSSNLFNIEIFIGNRSSPVPVDRRQFREHILNVIRVRLLWTLHIKGSFAQTGKRYRNCFVSKNNTTAWVLGSAKNISLRALFWRTICLWRCVSAAWPQAQIP